MAMAGMSTGIEALGVLGIFLVAFALRQIAQSLLVVAEAMGPPPPEDQIAPITAEDVRALRMVPADPINPYSQAGLTEEEAWAYENEHRPTQGASSKRTFSGADDERDALIEEEARAERSQWSRR